MFSKKYQRRSEVEQKLADFEISMAMIQHGWHFWPENAAEEQKKQAIERYIDTGEHRWYAPGETEEPVITDGKLQVEPTSVEENTKRWWQLW